MELPEYIEVFMETGMDQMSVIEDIRRDELNQMGINKLGHKMRILKEIMKLKQPQQNQSVAPAAFGGGSTAYV